MPNLDYYKVLGVPVKTTPDDLKKAYRVAVRKYHPDLHKGDQQAHKKMSEVNEAYETLSNPSKRQQYDLRNGAPRVINFTPPKQENNQNRGSASWKFEEEDLKEVFDSFFEGFGKQGRAQQEKTYYSPFSNSFVEETLRTKGKNEKGKDLSKKVTLTEEEALEGVEKDLKVLRYEKCVPCKGRGSIWGANGAKKCPLCHGTGVTKNSRILTLTIPGKLKTGMQVHIIGQGNAGKQGRKDGDLYLLITVKVKAQKKVQAERLSEVLTKIKALEKSYKQLVRKFTSKTFLKKTKQFIGPEWLGLGKLYGEYVAGKLEQEIETLKAEGRTLKKGMPEQLATKLKAFVEELAGKTEELQTELTLLKKSEKTKA